jgi:hypothetical protein
MDRMTLSKTLHRLEGSETGREFPTMEGSLLGFGIRMTLAQLQGFGKERSWEWFRRSERSSRNSGTGAAFLSSSFEMPSSPWARRRGKESMMI